MWDEMIVDPIINIFYSDIWRYFRGNKNVPILRYKDIWSYGSVTFLGGKQKNERKSREIGEGGTKTQHFGIFSAKIPTISLAKKITQKKFFRH